MKNKVIAIALALTTLVWAAPMISQGATTADLQVQIAALLAQISQLQAQLNQTGGNTSACFTKQLMFGMTDAQVTALQGALKGDTSIYPQGLVTGYFGSLTKAAVIKFQAKYGIDQVGQVGPITRVKLNSLYCSSVTPTPTPTGTITPTPPVTGGVSVMLASDNPAATSVIFDIGNTTGAQALAPFTKIVFTAGSNAAMITGLKLLRNGVSTNSDINDVYLYNGNTKLAEMNSITSDNMVNFSNADGLFTVPANSSLTITVKADITNATTGAGKTMRFGINSQTDIVLSGGASVVGSFPINGNFMTWAGVSDLGQYTFSSSTYPTAVDPSATVEREFWRMTSTGQNQKIALSYMKFTMIGTAASTDFKDFKLTIGSNVYGPVDMAADKTVTFDMSSNPYIYESGQTKNISLSGKVIGGASRSFYFAVQNRADVVVYDTNYGVFLKPNKSDTFTIIKAAGTTSINSGTLTIAKSTTTPTGSLPLGATSVTLANFDFTAAGENIKVTSLAAELACSSSTAAEIKNVKVLVDGSQIGSTDSTVTCGDSNAVSGLSSLGNTFIINAGQTRVVSLVADLTVTSGTPHASETITGELVTVADGYTRMTSGTTDTVTGIAGNALTLRSGAITVARNISFPSGTASNPTVVTGATGAKIGSFTVTAGLGEAVDLNQFVVKDVVGNFPTYYTNLKLQDSTGNQLGSTYGTLTATANTTYSFIPTTAVRVNAGQQSVFNIYADVKGNLSAGAAATTTVSAVYATGVTTSQTADDTTSAPGLQTVYVSAKGTLTVAIDAATPVTQQMVAGKTYEFGRFKLTAGTSEDVRMTDMNVSLKSDASANIADLTEFKLYDVSSGSKTLIAGPVYSVVADATTSWSGYVTFTGFSFTVPKSTNKIFSVEAKVSPWTSGESGNTQKVLVATDYLMAAGTSSPITAYGAQSNTQLLESDASLLFSGYTVNANAMTLYRDKISAAVASDSPSGATTPSSSHQIFKFVVSNESNDGSYSGTVTDMAVTLNATNLAEGGSHATLTRTFSLYKDSVTTANLIGEEVLQSAVSANSTYGGTIDFGTTSASALASGWTDYTVVTGSSTVFTTAGVEIPAGGSKTFILVADTTVPKITSTVTSYLNPTIKASIGGTYGLTWTDGDATGITTVDTLPLDTTSKTLSW